MPKKEKTEILEEEKKTKKAKKEEKPSKKASKAKDEDESFDSFDTGAFGDFIYNFSLSHNSGWYFLDVTIWFQQIGFSGFRGLQK